MQDDGILARCPYCDFISQSINVKRHIKETHEVFTIETLNHDYANISEQNEYIENESYEINETNLGKLISI